MKNQKISKKNTKKSAKSSNYLWMILMTASFAVLLWTKSDKVSHSVKGLTHLHEDMVDLFLKDVEAKKQYRQAKVEVENFYYAPEIDDFAALQPEESDQEKDLTYGVVMDQAGDAERISQEIAVGSQVANRQLPDEIINQRLQNRQDYEVYSQQMEQAYVDQFKENARKAGYQVEVDANLQVKRVRKIRNPGSLLDN